MQTIKVTTDNVVSIIDVNLNDFRALQQSIGADSFELVKTQKLWDYFGMRICMVCDEEAYIKEQIPDVNYLASYFYNHNSNTAPWLIRGDIIFVVSVRENLEGFENVQRWVAKLLKDFPKLRMEES